MIDEELDGGVLWGNDYEVDPIQNIDPIQNKEELNFCTDFIIRFCYATRQYESCITFYL